MIMGLRGPNMPNTHKLDDIRRFTITCSTWNNLLHLGAIILQELHITRYFNSPIGLVVVSIGVRVFRITNKYTLYSSSFKLTKPLFIVLNKTFASKDTNVQNIRFVTCEKLIWSFVMQRTEEEPVGIMNSSRDGFSPKIMG